MLGYSTLIKLFDNLLATGIMTGIYHSVMMKPLKEGSKPHAPVDGRWIYVGVDDTKGLTCYCRQNGSADVQNVEKLGACNNNKYRFQVPHRIVIYNASEKRDHEQIIALVSGAIMKTPLIRLQRIVNIPEEILRSEAPTGRFEFKDNTLYFAIEFFVLLDLQTDNCEHEIKCEGVPNPYCIAQQ